MELSSIDTYGQRIEENYSVILTDPSFERRLQAFDPNLRLMFDQARKRWIVMEWALDNSGWNCLIIAEDSKGDPKPLGEWVFSKLFVKRHNYELKKQLGADGYFNNLLAQAHEQQEQMAASASDDNQAMIREDITQWRKAAKEIEKGVAADATAGYRKF